MPDIFSHHDQQATEILSDIYLIRGLAPTDELLVDVKNVIQQAPLRFMYTPGGKRLNISMTNCGQLGWISDQAGYRYANTDPTSNQPWPAMPESFLQLAQKAATSCDFVDFHPNACLVNHYQAGQQMTAHQDRNEPDLAQPIVSVSLGMSARFDLHGDARSNRPKSIELYDGDVMVWGRSARLMYHAVKTNQSIPHPSLGLHRFNLTFRRA